MKQHALAIRYTCVLSIEKKKARGRALKRYYLRRYHLLSDSVEKKKARGRALKPFSFCFESTFWAFVEKKKARGRALKHEC